MKHIYDNVHKVYTSWSEPLLCIINTPEFQRLKRIKQLGACHHVFPGATHTRFEHSLGVGYLARRLVHTLQQNQPELGIHDETMLTFQIAGLCHDLGHGPMSHAFDDFLKSIYATDDVLWVDHEVRSVHMLKHIVQKYNVPISPQTLENACELIHPIKHTLPRWWYQVIANHEDNIDVDKFDYLLRDTMMTGVMCQDIDINRFIDYARVCHVHNGDGRTDMVLSYPQKLQFDVHQLFLTRHRLHTQVYQHPTVRGFEFMYKDILLEMKGVLENSICNDTTKIEWLMEWDDSIFTRLHIQMLEQTYQLETTSSNHVQNLLANIDYRNHYTLVKDVRLDLTGKTPESVLHKTTCDTIHTQYFRHISGNEWLETWFTDKVNIGYKTNPFYRVHFYTRVHKDNAQTLNQKDTSVMFPVHSRDCYVRVYKKQKKNIDCATANEDRSVHNTPPIVIL